MTILHQFIYREVKNIYCKRTFSKNSNLTKHKKLHTGETPYECVICKKTFSTSSNLTRHKRVHTGEKPFSCDACQKSYAHRSGLYAHIERMKSRNTNIPLLILVL